VRGVHDAAAGRILRRLLGDERGVAALEFALILPPFLLLIIGTIEVALVIFIGSSIEAAVLQASRYGITNATIPGVSREERVIDIVRESTYGLVDMSTVEIETLVYDSFSDIGEPEPFEDTNGNDVYEDGEPFTDVNGNGQWDPDMGAAGLGGPSDVVVYTVTYDWGIITPFMRRVMGESIRHISTVAVRNEPF
jgi:Flp pilus assembly pilin Flp